MEESKCFLQLTGRNQEHLEAWRDDCMVHREVSEALQALCDQGRQAGLDIKVASGFRSFERQLMIWNAKARGERPVQDRAGKALEIQRLEDEQKVFAILHWSALPGASRHHWGTDFDIWDAAAVPDDYRLQLHIDEYSSSGPFSALNRWLEEKVDTQADGFIRPYRDTGALDGRSGIAPEPWHISYAPVAQRYEAQCESSALKGLIAASTIELKESVLAHWEMIYTRYILPPK